MDTCFSLSDIKDFVSILTAPITVLFAYLGLRAWKRQLKGKDKYDSSKRLLKSVFKIRDAVKIVRNPFVDSSEQYMAIKAHDLKIIQINPMQWTKEDSASINRAVYATRWKSITDAFIEFEVERLESEILFKKVLQISLDKFVGHIISLNAALDTVLNNEAGVEENFRRAMRKIVFKQHGEGEMRDKYFLEFEGTIKEIENFLKPYIRL
jgi:hypothetical protein